MTSIKTLVDQGRYHVDPRLVADAVMARWFGSLAGDWWPQSECSNPSSSPSQSRNRTPG
jgi:hypothetical protein